MMAQMLSKRRGGEEPRAFITAQSAPTAAWATPTAAQQGADSSEPAGRLPPAGSVSEAPASGQKGLQVGTGPSAPSQAGSRRVAGAQSGRRAAPPPGPAGVDAAELLLDKQKAFEVFRQTVYKAPEAFEENKALLRERIAEAKAIGDEANSVRTAINEAKTRLEKLRTERAMTAAGYDDSAPLEDGPEELAEVEKIDQFKTVYKERTAQLRRVKEDIEGIQRLMEQSKVRMQRDFETWFVGLRQRAQLDALDEESKKELYEKVTGGTATSTPSSAKSSPTGTAVQAHSFGRPSPHGAAAVSERRADARSDDFRGFYRALGELARRV